MLITGTESDYGLRGELVVPNCEVLEHFGDFSELFRAFQRISRDFRMPGTIVCSRGRVKNLIAPCERTRQKVLYTEAFLPDRRFSRSFVTLNMTLTNPKS